ncbi:MAG: HAMP domain-containing sensor histidine kinase [Sandaracinus sp.]
MRAKLATRIAWAAALVVPLSGLLVVFVAWTLTRSMARDGEDTRLRDAAGVLARELEAPGAEPGAIAVDEADELVHTGMRVAVAERGARIAGDPTLGIVEAGQCEDRGARRVCGVAAGPWVALVGRDRERVEDPTALVLRAGLVAVALTSLLGGLLAWALGRRLAAPLTRLHHAVAAVSTEDLRRVSLGADEGVVEIDELRHALARSYATVGEALERERRFARDASHELRTPLTVLLGELELVAERLDADDRDAVLRARRVAERLAVLVERLLLLARPGASIVREEVALRDIVDDLEAALPPAARARVRAEGDCTVHGDAALLGALLSNALENALKFSTGPVRITLSHDADHARITVSDEGPGLSSADRERAFAAFFRGAEARASTASGHGVGLALVAHAAHLHGGQARFLDVSRGATLEVVLPIASASPLP